MEHVPTTEADDLKVFRIARELGISLEDAAITCAGFELAFSDDRMRQAIFEIIDQLDESAAKKGEPLGLILNYTVELGNDGIRVGRYADEIPPGQIVNLTPTDRAMIFLRINDNFPTQQFLGPLIVNRPKQEFDREISEPEITTNLPSEWADAVIHLGPIRFTLNDRFQFLSAAVSKSKPGFFLDSADRTPFAHPLSGLINGAAASHSGQSMSGLSPPLHAENLGHSKKNERCPAGPGNKRRDTRLIFGSLKI
jgi:hypothetical protein